MRLLYFWLCKLRILQLSLLILMELAMILLGNHISILYQQLYLIESLLMASLADLDPTLEPELYHYPSPV